MKEYANVRKNGLQAIVLKENDELIEVKATDDTKDIMMITNEGIIIRISVNDISVIGRNTSGVKLMNIDPDSNTRIASIAKVRDDGDKNEDEEDMDQDEEFVENETDN